MPSIREAVAAMQAQGGLEHPEVGPEVEALVRDVIAQVADKWTMLILEALEEHGTLRFTQLAFGGAVHAVVQRSDRLQLLPAQPRRQW